jgi:hypothetical protein
MSKADRILGCFPHYYRAGEPGKLLGKVVRDLAQPIDEADTHLFRIQRAHRIDVGEHPLDVVRLAALLGLTTFHFDDVLREARGTREERRDAAEQRLAMMRDRVKRIARLHLDGLGTPRGVLEAAAIFLNGQLVPDRPGDPLVQQIDPQGFSHRATIAFHRLPDRPREQIILHENPIVREKVEPAERWSMNSWVVENRNVDAATAIFAIEGIGERTVLPAIFCPATQEGLLFYGVVPEGKTLLIESTSGARIDALPVDEWLITSKGGFVERSQLDNVGYARDDGRPDTPFNGNLEELVWPPFRQKRAVPRVPIGRTDWYFKVADGIYDGSLYDFSVFDIPVEPVGAFDHEPGFDSCVYDYPANAVVGMAWDGRAPCAFKLLIPTDIPGETGRTGPQGTTTTDESDGNAGARTNRLSWLGSILDHFKAAGVRAYIDTARDTWILGSSVVRVPDASAGEGVDYHATLVRVPLADQYIVSESNGSNRSVQPVRLNGAHPSSRRRS